MEYGARTPEELETLFEDAFLLRDLEAVLNLFDDAAVFVAARGSKEARGRAPIARAARHLWYSDSIYAAGSKRVLQARDTALLLADSSTSVMRRDANGAWRFVISLMTDRSGGEVAARSLRGYSP